MLMNDKNVNQRKPCFIYKTEGSRFSDEYSGPEQNPGDDRLNVTVQNCSIQKSLSIVINGKHEESPKDDVLSASSLWPSEISPEEHKTSYESSDNKAISISDGNLIEESDLEVSELDVERVLEKQNTHDLYCPNCNSCITRRVILRKRKRKLRISSEDTKRNKLETASNARVEDISAHAANNQGLNAVDVCLDGSLTPAANDPGPDREPEIFRCLSCFSFFIPAGSGFKLFRIFGDKSDKKSVQDSQQILTKSKNWFPSVFTSDKRKMLMDQGSGLGANEGENNVGAHIPSSNLNGQNGQASLVPEAPSTAHLIIVEALVERSTKHYESRDEILPPSSQGPTELGKVVVDEGEKLDDAVKMNTGGAVNAVDKLDASSISDEVLLNHGSGQPSTTLAGRTPVNNGESTENAMLIPQQDGLKLLIPSVVDSSVREKLPIEQKNEVSTETKSADKETIFALQTPVAVLEGSDMNVKVSISADIPLKNDKNVGVTLLTERAIQDEDAIFKSTHKGKETVIIVEEGPIESTATQRAENIGNSPKTGHTPHTTTQLHVGRVSSTAREVHGVEIIKSIVYGGLIESITSLGVVSSAAAGDAATLNILALGLANLIGGLFVMGHDLWELKKYQSGGASNQETEQVDQYQELLGRRQNFLLHATAAVLSFLIVGLLPPVIYGFSFRRSDDRDLKLVAVAAASLLCIILLSIGKVYVQRPPKSYITTVVYYVMIGFGVSAVSFAVGNLIMKLLEKLGLFQSSSLLTLPLLKTEPVKPVWASY
ncbi:unnamed protein product [Ilex paraguariensis]|uniref:Membrane protein of ER body-like protein n=1 Tax=Ilex paraguariensis TaxID=185542 RepID=A0ABC8STN7_9AQUA